MANPAAYPGAPRWAKILAFTLILLVVVMMVAHLAGGHGLSHHQAPGDPRPSAAGAARP